MKGGVVGPGGGSLASAEVKPRPAGSAVAAVAATPILSALRLANGDGWVSFLLMFSSRTNSWLLQR